MLPPPALTVSIRTAGRARASPATVPPPSPSGVPPVTRLASALVPPMSSVRRSCRPTAAPTRRAPTTPPAGPESASDAARVAAPLGDRHDVGPSDQGRRVVAGEVVERCAVLAPQPQEVFEALGRHECDAGTAALEIGIGRNRSTVNEQLDGVGGGLQRAQRAQQADGGIVRRRYDLSDFDRAVSRERDEIGEGPADIHPYPHRPTAPLRIGDCGLRIGRRATLPPRIRNPKSAIHNLTSSAPIAICPPTVRRRTPGWPKRTVSPPSRPGARRGESRRWCEAGPPPSLPAPGRSPRTCAPGDRGTRRYRHSRRGRCPYGFRWRA